MRVYVGQLAVYFTSNSINKQIFITPGRRQLEVIAEDKRGYISATILNITVTSQSQTTISNIQSMSGWQSCFSLFPPGSIQRVARQGAINRILKIRSETVVTAFPTVADAGLESTRRHAFESLICEVCYGESASSALL
ncbi:MAG TPA: hypothetical protein VI685_11090 [Candidatus Angelobacter sp.]